MNDPIFNKLKEHKISYIIGNDFGEDFVRIWKRRNFGKISDTRNDSLEFCKNFLTVQELIDWFNKNYKEE